MQLGPHSSSVSTLSQGLRSIVDLVRARVLDAELAALVGLLVEGGVPLVLAGVVSAGERTAVLRALTWSTDVGPAGRGSNDQRPTRPLFGDLDAGPPDSVLLGRLRGVGTTAAAGAGLALGMQAGSLEEVFARLRAEPVGLTDDQISLLGLVLVLAAVGRGSEVAQEGSGSGRSGGPWRIASAHYLRPLARDAGGHVQRLGPAVLSTWDPVRGQFEHYAWGVMAELAARIGERPADLEREQAHRARHLAEFAAAPGLVVP